MIEYFVEVPNTNIKESVGHRLGDAWGICYDLAQEFGFAEVCLTTSIIMDKWGNKSPCV